MGLVGRLASKSLAFLVVSSMLASGSHLLGQAVDVASVSGVVTDSSEAAVANAAISITQTARRITQTTISDSTGHF